MSDFGNKSHLSENELSLFTHSGNSYKTENNPILRKFNKWIYSHKKEETLVSSKINFILTKFRILNLDFKCKLDFIYINLYFILTPTRLKKKKNRKETRLGIVYFIKCLFVFLFLFLRWEFKNF